MAAKSVLKSSVSAVLAAVLGMGLMLPAAASAQERDRGERGSGRMERGMSAPAPSRSAPPTISRSMDRPAPSTAQAPSWQGRGQASTPQQGWNGRPAWSPNVPQGAGQPDRGPRPGAQMPGAGGRPAWQQADRGDRGNNGRPSWQQGDRGDRGNNGGAGFGRPGGVVVPPATVTNTNPSWGGRNPTYVDPRRNPSNGQQDWNRGNNGNWSRDRDRDGNRDRDRNWANGGNRNWNQGRDRDRDRDWNRNGNWNRGRDWNRNGYASNQWRGNGNWGNNGYGRNNWDRNGWRRDYRYNWLGWRNSHRDVFRGGFYSAPFSGYSYSRLSIGLFLGNAFFDQRYWIADPYAYRLPPAYAPYQWVRYYDDVVLVDTYTGEVVDVIYDFFW